MDTTSHHRERSLPYYLVHLASQNIEVIFSSSLPISCEDEYDDALLALITKQSLCAFVAENEVLMAAWASKPSTIELEKKDAFG